MKRLIFLLTTGLAFAATAVTPPSYFDIYYDDTRVRYEVNNDGTTVSIAEIANARNDDNSTDLTIPSTVSCSEMVDGRQYEWSFTVTTVKGSAFWDRYTSFNSLTLPPTVTRLEPYAFSNNVNCRFFDLGGNVEYIGRFAFYDGLRIKSISNIGDKLEYVGGRAFMLCRYMETLDLGDNVSFLGDSAFYECFRLQGEMSLTRVDTLRSFTFYNCDSLRAVTLGEGLKAIKKNAFYYGHGIKRVNFPSTLESIGDYAFFGCGLQEAILNDGLIDVGECAFQRSGVTRLRWPGTAKVIKKQTFSQCPTMEEVTIEEGLEEIDYYNSATVLQHITLPQSLKVLNSSFSCRTQEDLTLPNNITTVNYNFAGFAALKRLTLSKSLTTLIMPYYKLFDQIEEIHCRMPQPVAVNIDLDNYGEAYNRLTANCTLFVPKGTRNFYTDPDNDDAAFWRGFANIVEEDGDSTLPGDVNGDNTVNAGDISNLYENILKGGEYNPLYDINGDNAINVGDISSLFNIILSGK